jgi:uncharacterized protein YlxW (UPF0749 family)
MSLPGMSEHDRPGAAVPEEPRDAAEVAAGPQDAAGGDDVPGEHAPEEPGEVRAVEEAEEAGEPGEVEKPEEPGDEPAAEVPEAAAPEPPAVRRRRNRLAAPLIGILCLLLGFAFAVQVRSTDTGAPTAGQREEDLVRILDNLNNQEDRLRQQIADQRAALDQLTSSDSQSAAALQEARSRAQAIGILNGTVAAQGPGLRMTIRDPERSVQVADLLDVIEELRGAGAETMQIDGIRVGVSTAVTGDPGALALDDQPLKAPYDVLVIGSPQDLQTAMNIPGGVVQRITGEGGSVDIVQEQQVVVDALRPLDQPQYASPKTGG